MRLHHKTGSNMNFSNALKRNGHIRLTHVTKTRHEVTVERYIQDNLVVYYMSPKALLHVKGNVWVPIASHSNA